MMLASQVRSSFIKHSQLNIISKSLCTANNATKINDFKINPKFKNRNPKNLEQMLLAWKPKGYHLEKDKIQYWHTIKLEKTGRYITANVLNNSGKIVVSASTKEWGIKKQLYSPGDLTAVKNIGRVIAQRSLESGILSVHANFRDEDYEKSTIRLFCEAAKEGGLRLKEPTEIVPITHLTLQNPLQ